MKEKELSPKIEVKASRVHGHGVFTREALRRGEWIGRFHGKLTQRDGAHVLWVPRADGTYYGIRCTNELRYLNHARPSNCEFVEDDLYAARSIRAGEEIFLDYGEDW
ncbi:MAG: SET domain-containing protein [Gammaproteobacteria bacterium]